MSSLDFTLCFLPVVLLQKLSPSTMCLQVLHLVLSHILTMVWVSWVASVKTPPTDVGFNVIITGRGSIGRPTLLQGTRAVVHHLGLPG